MCSTGSDTLSVYRKKKWNRSNGRILTHIATVLAAYHSFLSSFVCFFDSNLFFATKQEISTKCLGIRTDMKAAIHGGSKFSCRRRMWRPDESQIGPALKSLVSSFTPTASRRHMHFIYTRHYRLNVCFVNAFLHTYVCLSKTFRQCTQRQSNAMAIRSSHRTVSERQQFVAVAQRHRAID